jgi:CheY-like chemotaxis protein
VIDTRTTAESGRATGRILFVYPVGLDRDLYLSGLNRAGFETTVEATVQAAGIVLETAEPDLIVMELLPEPSEAWAFIERQRARVPAVPLIILTSLIRPDRANRRRAHALGCAAFVAKPCSVPQLVDVVARVRHGSRGLEISTYNEPLSRKSH